MKESTSKWRRWLRWLRTTLVFLLILLLICDLAISWLTRRQIHTTLEAVPEGAVCLVLGTSKYKQNGGPNLFYQGRINAAAELFLGDRVNRLILSGTSTEHYDEPEAMKEDLRALLVPERVMVLDGKGFRTADSILRAQRVYEAKQLVIVSQRFHAQRAVFLARAFGIDACGYAAEDMESAFSFYTVRVRELFARARAVLDVVLYKVEGSRGDHGAGA